MENKGKSKEVIKYLVPILVLFIVLGFSYAYWRSVTTQDSTNVLNTLNCLEISLTDVTSAINFQNEYPISNAEGMNREPYTFKIKNLCDVFITTDITLEVLSSSTLGSAYVRASLNEWYQTFDNSKVLTSYDVSLAPTIPGATSYVLANDVTILPYDDHTYDLRLWVDEATTTAQGKDKVFNAKIVVIISPMAQMSKAVMVISAGFDGSAAITANGNLYYWGYGYTPDEYLALGFWELDKPNHILPDHKFKAVSVSDSAGLAIAVNGDLWGWGGYYFELKNSFVASNNWDDEIPHHILPGTKFKTVSSGIYCYLAISESGDLYAWGEYCDLSSSSIASSWADDELNHVLPGTKFKSISAYTNCSGAITDTGDLYIWGKDCDLSSSMVAGGTWQDNQPNHILPGIKFKEISTQTYGIAAISENGNLYVGGIYLGLKNKYIASGAYYNDELNHVLPGTKFKTVDAHYCVLAVTADDELNAWGEYCDLADDTVDALLWHDDEPNLIMSNTKFKGVALGVSHYMLLSKANNIYAWGANRFCQLGNRNCLASSPMIALNGLLVKEASLGNNHALFLANTGYIYGNGINHAGQLGTTFVGTNKAVIELTLTIPDMKFKKISAGMNFGLGIDEADNLYAWGFNGGSQLGDGTTVSRSTPALIKSDTKFKAIATGAVHSLAIADNGVLYAWGNNSYRQLGDGTTTLRPSPVVIKSGTQFKAISGSVYHSLGIAENGDLYAWGTNSNRQLGDGTTTTRSTPVLIKSGTPFKAISAGTYYSLGIAENGDLYAWGDNRWNQLGDGTKTNRSTPVLIKSGTKFKAISASGYHSLGIAENGDLYIWGDSSYGELGTGVRTSYSTPYHIMSGTKFKAIDAYNSASLAISEEGKLYAWGINNYYQLGIIPWKDWTMTPRMVVIE